MRKDRAEEQWAGAELYELYLIRWEERGKRYEWDGRREWWMLRTLIGSGAKFSVKKVVAFKRVVCLHSRHVAGRIEHSLLRKGHEEG